jgi:hypothetical protein
MARKSKAREAGDRNISLKGCRKGLCRPLCGLGFNTPSVPSDKSLGYFGRPLRGLYLLAFSVAPDYAGYFNILWNNDSDVLWRSSSAALSRRIPGRKSNVRFQWRPPSWEYFFAESSSADSRVGGASSI